MVDQDGIENLDYIVQIINNDIPIDCSGKISDFYFTYSSKYQPINLNSESENYITIHLNIHDLQENYYIKVNNDMIIKDLIELIQNTYLDENKECYLLYNGNQLNINNTINQLNIREGETIDVALVTLNYPISSLIQEINETYNNDTINPNNLNLEDSLDFEDILLSTLENFFEELYESLQENEDNRETVSYEQINNLYPVKKYENINNSINDKCVICYQKFLNLDNVRVLSCDHVFHSDCIDKWLTEYDSKCPFCKKQF